MLQSTFNHLHYNKFHLIFKCEKIIDKAGWYFTIEVLYLQAQKNSQIQINN